MRMMGQYNLDRILNRSISQWLVQAKKQKQSAMH